MRHERNDDASWDVAGRLQALEQFTGVLVARPVVASEAIPIVDAPPSRVPAPRRSRVFLRSAKGSGAFADLTLTTPVPRPAVD